MKKREYLPISHYGVVSDWLVIFTVKDALCVLSYIALSVSVKVFFEEFQTGDSLFEDKGTTSVFSLPLTYTRSPPWGGGLLLFLVPSRFRV